jgi:predicted phage terminase large subunit-like protein
VAGENRKPGTGNHQTRSGQLPLRRAIPAASVPGRRRDLQAVVVALLETPGIELPPVSVRLADGSWQQVNAVELPEEFDQQWQSWDMAFKDLDTSDYVVGQVWGASGADRFLLDQRRERMSFPQTVEAVKALSAKWPKAARKLIEDKANGTAVIASLQHEIEGLIAVNPEGGKVARAHATSPRIEAGNVYLPHPAYVPWVEDFLEECASFPAGRNDDKVDAMTQALNRQIGDSIYASAESEIVMEPFSIPIEWPRGWAMDVGRGTTGVIWGAWNRQSDTVYLYDEYLWGDADPSVHARAIRHRGAWIPGLMELASPGRSEAECWKLMEMYKQQGLHLDSVPSAADAGLYAVRERMSSGRLKVFSSLPHYLEQRRLYRRDHKGEVLRQNDHLLNCAHCLILFGMDGMRSAQPRKKHGPVYTRPPRGDGLDWMRW